MDEDTSLRAQLLLRKGRESAVGESRIRLLRQIDAEGSITAAAKAVGLSYKGAWDAVQALNNLAGRPLIVAHTGGRRGGKAEVTAAGRALVEAFDRIESVLDDYAGRVQSLLNGHDADLDALLRSLSMKTSARNTYRGMVTAIRDGAVNTEVLLKVSDDIELCAVITRESVEDLGLAPGKPAMALIKSSFVILAAGHDPLPVSARNRLKGVVIAVTPGAVNDEVTLEFGAGKTMTAVVTRASREELGLGVGQPAQALVKASHIILAVD
jgi:molybdate transport system regulatory protein